MYNIASQRALSRFDNEDLVEFTSLGGLRITLIITQGKIARSLRHDNVFLLCLVQVQYAICIRDERPALANGCPSLLGQLLLRCWSKDWHKRPSANELCTIFRRLWHIEQGKYDNKVVADATDLATILKDLRLGDMPQTLEDTCIV